MKNKQSYFSIKHNKETKELTIILTSELQNILESFERKFHIQMLQSTKTVEDVYTDDGEHYIDCVVVRTSINEDEIEPVFDAFKAYMRQGISDSINHSDN